MSAEDENRTNLYFQRLTIYKAIFCIETHLGMPKHWKNAHNCGKLVF